MLAFPYLFTKETQSNSVSLSWNYIGESNAPTTFPGKDNGYVVDNVTCTNGTGTWDNEAWGIRVANLTGSTKCTVTFDDISTDTSGANPPELIDGLIPVTWNGTGWVKADTSTEWYNYDTQMWANAVTVTNTSRTNYVNASPNTPISMDDIETMWVWIPRYSYTIKSEDGTNYYGRSMPEVGGISPATLETPGAVDIKFIEIDTKELGTAQYTGDDPKEWRTPDAFTFGEEELTGFWAGKFDVSNEFSKIEDTTEYDPIIKPNVRPWGWITVSNAFTVSRKLTAEGNRYGLDTNADGHMMKNSEWGAVSYLSQSKYGKYGNATYSGTNKQVYKNDGFYTGRSEGFAPTEGEYTTDGSYTYEVEESGTGASTTGTIYGVYDMNGLGIKRVMANYDHRISNSGFSSLPDSKYYDSYTATNVSTACNGGVCYGHALSETIGWYRANTDMQIRFDWISRGSFSYSSSDLGIFSFSSGSGDVGDTDSLFRATLIP